MENHPTITYIESQSSRPMPPSQAVQMEVDETDSDWNYYIEIW